MCSFTKSAHNAISYQRYCILRAYFYVVEVFIFFPPFCSCVHCIFENLDILICLVFNTFCFFYYSFELFNNCFFGSCVPSLDASENWQTNTMLFLSLWLLLFFMIVVEVVVKLSKLLLVLLLALHCFPYTCRYSGYSPEN